MTASSRLTARLALIVAVAATGFLAIGEANASRGRSFTASYAGTGSGRVSGTKASGRAAMSGRGTLIGRSTLKGSGAGTLTSSECLSFSGRATLKGARGSLKLAVRHARGCASRSAVNDVSFSGRARVTGGTSEFAGARGRLSFRGTYDRSTRAVSISFRGRITY